MAGTLQEYYKYLPFVLVTTGEGKLKPHVTISLSDEVLTEGRRIAGLVPFSRFVEDLLRKEIARRGKMPEGGRKTLDAAKEV